MALLMPYSSFGKNLICSPQIQHTSFALYPGCLAPTCHSFIVAEQPVSVTNKIIVDKIFFIPYSSIYKPKCQCRKSVGFAGFFVNRWMTKVLEHKHIIIRAEVSNPITKRNKAIKFLNRIIKAISFNQIKSRISYEILNSKSSMNVLIKLKENIFNSKKTIQVEIIDILKSTINT